MYEYFETRTRADGTTYTTLTDDRPDWLQEAVYTAHDHEGPNDWRYETCANIAEAIDEGDDDSSAIADRLTDIYTSDLLAWLAGHIERTAYCDDARAEGLTAEPADLISQITTGQYYCIEQMASILLAAQADES